jgi:hypothetical protein
MAESATSVGSLTFLGLLAMFSQPSSFFRDQTAVRECPRQLIAGRVPARHRVAGSSASPPHPQTSYWEGEANEMVAINAILIIVNSAIP